MVTNIINHKDNLSSTLKLKIDLLGIEDNLEEGFNNFLEDNIDLTDVNAIKNSFIK